MTGNADRAANFPHDEDCEASKPWQTGQPTTGVAHDSLCFCSHRYLVILKEVAGPALAELVTVNLTRLVALDVLLHEAR